MGVWPFTTLALVLTCSGSGGCAIVARTPATGEVQWTQRIPGLTRSLAGVNRGLRGTRQASRAFALTGTAPRPLPALLGLEIDNRTEVIETRSGRRHPAVSAKGTEAVAVIGDRVLVTSAASRGDRCQYAVEARQAATGKVVWKRPGIDAHTVAGLGCDQRRAPTGAGDFLAVEVDGGDAAVVRITDGAQTWAGTHGQVIRALDGQIALVHSSDTSTVAAVGTDNGAVRWTQKTPKRVTMALCPGAALIRDDDAGRLRAFDRSTGATLADRLVMGDLVGCGASGLIIARGRTVGYLPWER